jgi:RNA polymerase sigma-54 factor
MSGIGMNLGMRAAQVQGQYLAPRMIQSMEILQMPVTDLLEKVQAELQENPFLEVQEKKAGETAVETEFNPDGVLKHDDTGDLEFNRLEEMNRDWNDHFDAEHRPSRGAMEEMSDRKLDAMQNAAESPPSLQEHLVEQLAYQELDPAVYELTEFVISHLDDNGYLLRHDPDSRALQPIEAADLARDFHAREVPPDEMEEAVRVVQGLDPAGVGARDTKECLLLQVTDETPHAELVRTLIRDHLEDVAYNRLPLIQKRTGFALDDIGEAIDELRKLDPKPGARFAADPTRYVVPDVIVERTDDGEFTVRLTDDWLPRVRISKQYVAVKKDRSQPKPVREMLKDKFQKANWLLSAIEQRRTTLRRVTEEIVKHQRAFFDLGPDHIQPLKMEQIADRVGVHVTTVSRAVDDKWVQTPRGVFPLRRFFGGGTKAADGHDVAWETIKNKLLEIIGEECKKSPLSDEDIVKRFTDAGLTIARRTVTKYREALKIPSSRQRRDWTAA